MHYMQRSRLELEKIRKYTRPEIISAPPHKIYPDAKHIPLLRQWPLEEARITSLLQERRSHRTYQDKPVSLQSLSYMLWASQGVTAVAGDHLYRTAPSAGALYPVETYIVAQRVADLEPGIYHFNVTDFELDLLQTGDHSEDIALAFLNQQCIGSAALVFVWTAVFRRNMAKYGDRGLRYIFLEAGHICQNLLLAAEATGYGGCPVAAFFDTDLNEILEVDGEDETSIYAASIGVV
jgi:SagB-type dehydrogenase family enzyme